MAGLVVGVPVTAGGWRHDLHDWVTDHVPGVELVVVHEPSEVLGADLDAVVVDDSAEFVTPAQLVALRDQGVRVVGLCHPSGGGGRGREWLTGLGVAEGEVLEVGTDPATLVDALVTVDEATRSRRRRRVNGQLVRPASAPVPRGPWLSPGPRGMVVVVGGGSDSPGRTEVAIAVAQCLAARAPTVLVDVDERHPSVASRLGLHLTPALLEAAATVRAGGDVRGCVASRQGWARARGDIGPDVICGLAQPSVDCAQLGDLRPVLEALAGSWRFVVVDTGPSVGVEEARAGGVRTQASRTAVEAADVVLAVCRGTPQGVIRLMDWAADAARLLGGRRMMVAVNQAPRSRYHRGELHGLVVGHLSRVLADVVWLDRDAAVEAAVWDAGPVRQGRFVSGVEAVVGRLVPGGGSMVSRSRRALARGGGR